MKGLGERLAGDAEHFSFEERIFNFAILIGIFLTAFGTIMDLHYKANILADLVFTVCWLLTYYFSRYKGHFNAASVVSTGIFVFVFIPYNWIFSGGSGSVLPYYTIAFITIISIILKDRLRIAIVLSMLAVELLLIGRDAYNAGSLAGAIHSRMNFLDFSMHIFVIMAALTVMIIVYSNTFMRERERSERYAGTIEEQYRQQLYYMENLEQLVYKLRSERHDFNNHLGVVYGLLEGGEADRAGAYAKQLVKNAEEYRNIVTIPYPTLRAMLNYKLSAAGESKLRLGLDISVPEGLKLNEYDLAVILGNLLDNAVEACAEIEGAERYINLSVLYKPDYLIIRMENPAGRGVEIKDGKVRTTKPDAENHGFGLNNIKYLVNRHNGLIKIGIENDIFKVSIALLVDNGQG